MTVREITPLVLTLGMLACVSPRPQADGDLPRAGPGVLYAIGANLGEVFAIYHFDDDELREITRGFTDAAQRKPYVAPLEADTSANVTAFNEKRLQELARREEQASAPFLEAAAREPGAVKTDSGMILRVLENGSGPSPTIWDWVTINYHGTRADGTVFQTNRGEKPLRIRLGTTTRCWQQAFTVVEVGARMHVVCPPALTFGWAGVPGLLEAGAVVSYDLELLAVEPMPEPKS